MGDAKAPSISILFPASNSMKLPSSKLFALFGALAALFFGTQAHGVPINITNSGGVLVGDVSKGELADNSLPSQLAWLTGQVSGYNTITSSSLPTPTGGVDASASMGGSVSLVGYTYATVHYGKGGSGTGQGGGIVAYYLNGETAFTFPQTGLGPNGMGGISSVYLFGPSTQRVPDGGSAVALLGATLVGAVILRRFKRRA